MKTVMVTLVLGLVVLGQLDISAAFEHRRFHVHGYMQWIAGEKLLLRTDDGALLAIDISELDQRSYHAVEQGEGITVSGVVKPPEDSDARLLPFLALWMQSDNQ